MSESAELAFVCPECGQEFLVTPPPSAALVACPHCHAQVLVPGQDGSMEWPEGAESQAGESQDGESPGAPSQEDQEAYEEMRRRHAAEQAREAELDGLRIRQLSRQRRAIYRSISYTLIAAIVCGVSVLQCLWESWLSIRIHQLAPAAGYVIFAVLLAGGSLFFVRRTAALRKEAAAHHEQPPQTPPDFSTLSDGSQVSKNLENIRL